MALIPKLVVRERHPELAQARLPVGGAHQAEDAGRGLPQKIAEQEGPEESRGTGQQNVLWRGDGLGVAPGGVNLRLQVGLRFEVGHSRLR